VRYVLFGAMAAMAVDVAGWLLSGHHAAVVPMTGSLCARPGPCVLVYDAGLCLDANTPHGGWLWWQLQSKRSWLWCTQGLTSDEWSISIRFRVSGQGQKLFGDGTEHAHMCRVV
jgi:hypothetical protein